MKNVCIRKDKMKQFFLRIFCLFTLLLGLLNLAACKKAQDENLLVDDQDIFESSENEKTPESADPVETRIFQPETEGEEETPILQDSKIFNTWNGIAENDQAVFFLQSCHTTSPQTWFIVSADRVSGLITPLCSKPDCSHQQISCSAYVPGSMLTAVSVSENRLYYATNLNSGMGSAVYGRRLPDGAAEEVCSVLPETFFPAETNYMMNYSQHCFYDGDYYLPLCGGSVPDGRNVRGSEFYITVQRSPVTSGRPEKTVVQDKISGFDRYEICLMPREDGLFIIEKMVKEEQTENGFYPLTTRLDIYLYTSTADRTESVFSAEYGEGLYISRYTLHGGKVFLYGIDRNTNRSGLYVQSMTGSEPKLLFDFELDPNQYNWDVWFTEDLICIYRTDFFSDEPDTQFELYDYEGKQIRSFTVNRPDVLKPENTEDYLYEGRLMRDTSVIGNGAESLYLKDFYSSIQGESREYVFSVSLDGLRVTPFVGE